MKILCRNKNHLMEPGSSSCHICDARDERQRKKCLLGDRVSSRSRHVLEIKLGRKLTKDEVAHHKDYNPGNDSPDNLQALTHTQHNWVTKRDSMAFRILRLELMIREARVHLDILKHKVDELGII